MKTKDVTIIEPSMSIKETINSISNDSKKIRFPGIAIILNNKKLLGIVTDGDIRRAFASGVNFKLPIKRIMNKNPIILYDDIPIQNIVTLTRRAVAESNKLKSDHVKYIILVDKNKNFKRIYDYSKLISEDLSSKRTVAVIGMGYVGLTLATSLANKGHIVTGIDTNKRIIKNLTFGKTDIYEPGLSTILKSNIKSKKIRFLSFLDSFKYDIYIIGVGTPIYNGRPNLKYLKLSAVSISKKLKTGDQIMLRSTVPVGTTRNIIIKILEKGSNLKAGKDFYVSFTPERTVEGNALYELRNLPQIIGGYSGACSKASADFWSTFTRKIIKVESLEAAELIKLANNTFRDVSFAFSNELALKCNEHNINAFALINAANDGYPRNQIPQPSPGVGGSCLTKDPILYSTNKKGTINSSLGTYGRRVNKQAGNFVLKVLNVFSKKINKPVTNMNILIVGLTFKGEPENYDIRFSVPVEVYNKLRNKCKNIFLWDGMIKKKHNLINDLISETELEKKINKIDAILFLNNNKKNLKVFERIRGNNIKLIFDGWNQLDQAEVEKNKFLIYSTMGYIGC